MMETYSTDNWAKYCRRAKENKANPNDYDYTPAWSKEKILEANQLLIQRADNEWGYEVLQVSTRDHKVHKRPIFVQFCKHKHGKSVAYPTVSIYNYSNGKQKVCQLHRLVYLEFIGDIPKGYVVDHINNDSFDNHPENLQLLTRADNIRKNSQGHNQWTYLKKQDKILYNTNEEESK